MKVGGTKSTQSAGSAKKAGAAKKSGGPSFSSALDAGGEADAVESASGAVAAGPVAAVDALLALQEVDGSGDALSRQKRRKAMKRGEDMLEGLDEIRKGLLMGAIPLDKLERLATVVSAQQDAASDPELASVLAEIELRARVEIAKYRSK